MFSTTRSLLPTAVGLVSQSSVTLSLSQPANSVVVACDLESEGHTATHDKRVDVHCK